MYRVVGSQVLRCCLTSSFAFAVTLSVGCKAEVATPQPTVSTLPAATAPIAPAETARPEQPFVLEEGFESLAFPDFEAFAAQPETWSSTAEGILCTGKPKGYLYSKQSYQNFTLRLEYRFPRPESLKDETKFKGNTGFMVYITGEHKQWPVCLEVQGKHVQMAAIKENGGAEPVKTEDDDVARQQARQPVGQWNSIEITSKDGALTVLLNGTPISKCEPNFISEGPIGIQAEDHPFEVRRMRIRRDKQE
jgi:Domain of Unknown Function (DUF1080)